MSFGRRSPLRGCSAILILAASAHAETANDGNSIPHIMVDLIRKGTSIDAAPPANYSKSRQILTLAKPVIAPNVFDHDPDFSRVLDGFDKIPVIANNELELGTVSIYQTLAALKNDIVVSAGEPTATNSASLDQARKLLFKPNGLPTDDYSTYLRFESDHKRMLDKIKAETDPANQEQQRTALIRQEREWEILGNRSAIASAISQFESGKKQSDPSRVQTWLSVVRPLQIPQTLSLALAGTQWLRFSYSNTSAKPISATTPSGTSVDLGKLRRISFDATIVWLDRAYLTSPFLADRGWKTRSGRVVSTGMDRTTEDLVPEVISGLLIAKNVELQTADDLPGQILDLLREGQDFNIDGIAITKKQTIPYGFQTNQMTFLGPIILGAVVDHLRKIPDPAPGREWPN